MLDATNNKSELLLESLWYESISHNNSTGANGIVKKLKSEDKKNASLQFLQLELEVNVKFNAFGATQRYSEQYCALQRMEEKKERRSNNLFDGVRLYKR